MARFLFTVWPFAGHVHPCMAVAVALRQLGHEVGFYTGAAFQDSVEQQSCHYFPFDRVAQRLSALVGGDKGEELYRSIARRYSTIGLHGMDRARRIGSLFREMMVGTIPDQFADVKQVIERWRPDAIITDAMMWSPSVMIHERLNTPVAVFSFYAGCLIPGDGMPPLGLGLPPAKTLSSKLLNRGAAVAARFMTASLRQEVNRIRATEGLPPLRDSVLAHGGKMPLYLVASIPELDYQRNDLPASVHYVGPCLWDKASGAKASAWTQTLRSEPPLIYVSEGTAQLGEPRLLRTAIEAFAGQDVQVIVTTGTQRALQLSDLPPNVRVEQWVPHSEVFPKASLVITNGGSGTVRQALLCGVPLLIAPMEWDQLENAARICAAGAAVRINPSRCTPESIRTEAMHILKTPSYQERARKLSKSLAQAGQAGRAAQLIGRLAARSNVRALRMGGI